MIDSNPYRPKNLHPPPGFHSGIAFSSAANENIITAFTVTPSSHSAVNYSTIATKPAQKNSKKGLRACLWGFQGQESDSELKGSGNSINYKYRMHDPRIGRFFAVDPISHLLPFLSPYQHSSLNPIGNIEIEGLEGLEVVKTYDCNNNNYVQNVIINEQVYFGVYVTSSRIHCYPRGFARTEKQPMPDYRYGFVSISPMSNYYISSSAGSAPFTTSELATFAINNMQIHTENHLNETTGNTKNGDILTESYLVDFVVEGESFQASVVRNIEKTASSYQLQQNVIIQARNQSVEIQELTRQLTSAGYNVVFQEMGASFTGTINIADNLNQGGINLILQSTVDITYDIKIVKTEITSIKHVESGLTVSKNNK